MAEEPQDVKPPTNNTVIDVDNDAKVTNDVKQKDQERPLMEDDLTDIEQSTILVSGARQSANDEQLVVALRNIRADDCFVLEDINIVTLMFDNKDLEKEFHSRALTNQFNTKSCASARAGYTSDVLVSLLFVIIISVASFLVLPWTAPFLIVAIFAIVLLGTISIVSCARCRMADRGMISKCFYAAAPSNLLGALVISLPCAVVYSFASCSTLSSTKETDAYLLIAIATSLFHFVNFANATFILKNVLAVITACFQIIFMVIKFCDEDRKPMSASYETSTEPLVFNVSTSNDTLSNRTYFWSEGSHMYEIIVNIILLTILIISLNRSLEYENRVLFHRHTTTKRLKEDMEKEQTQVQLFLDNVIPKYIASDLEDAARKGNVYSKNHQAIGVIFAKITNFEDLYDEGFAGGMEYLRVLNELMGDFEALLAKEEFRQVEKIKTIGPCLMAASGLDTEERQKHKNPKRHMYSLMDYSISVLEVMQHFNEGMLNFDFEMSIGFNVGEVTAGVIGKQKMQYDIWGDTVNVASRMYSTGVPGKIQVTEQCMDIMKDMYDFKYRGQTFVKGKGDLNTYLLVQKKST